MHQLIQKYPEYALITPIKGSVVDALPTWPAAFAPEKVKQILDEADDAEGKYLWVPSAGADIFFDWSCFNRQRASRTVAGFRIFHEFDPSYGSKNDIAGGVGLDCSASVLIDFSTMPNRATPSMRR